MDPIAYARALRARTDVHFNCCQSVVIPFCTRYGVSEAQAFATGRFFGAGMGCGAVCGAVSGGLMVLGLSGGTPADAAALRSHFIGEHGTLNCAELLSAAKARGVDRDFHCNGLVEEVAAYLAQALPAIESAAAR
ncbi:MAG: C-GCAxxG-C-C family protein [Oscillospiraceae bacterium]|nr:C-GCAxxG-C-C family protein [Oscillospiraceae bacterium]